MKTRRTGLALVPPILLAILAAAFLGPFAPATATHPTFTVSTGIYRIPYVDGTSAFVSNDHHNHNPVDRIDLGAGQDTQVVAAASGWIRAIIDHHGNDPGAGDGLAADQITPQDDSLEHSCGNNDPTNTVAGACQDHNNYVWIEHPNGEWTKYTHFGTGTVTDLGWELDDWVNAGDVLGLESDVGQATNPNGPAYHLHFEVAVANPPGSDLDWADPGGGRILNGAVNLVPFVCTIDAPSLFVEAESYPAGPCDNGTPTADAGGPYTVDEGASVQLDAGGSSDPEDDPLVYLWDEDDSQTQINLDNRRLTQPAYTGVDDGAETLTVTAYDQHLGSSDSTTVTVENVAPTVTAVGDTIDEGGTATLSATFTDPGTLDTHTASIDWGDGSPLTMVGNDLLASGVNHVFGDNGVFTATVTVTDDDGGVGQDTTDIVVGNLDPAVVLDTGAAVEFPGGDYFVVEHGAPLPSSADASDAGSDDLTFTWSTGAATTYFNDGHDPDPLPSPFGTFPFAANDQIDAVFAVPGLEPLEVTASDDDGGSATAGGSVLVTGTATQTEGSGWWKHQYSGAGSTHVEAATLEGYLEVVPAASSVFTEQTPLATMADAHEVLSPTGGDRLARAEAALLVAWLQFASGAVAWDAQVPLAGGTSVAFLDLLFAAEAVILDGTASDAELIAVEQDLDRVRHAD